MLATLLLLEWWNQPPTFPMAQQSIRQTVAFLDAKTYGTFGFGSPDQLSQSFSFVPYDLSYRMFAVPPQSVAVFEVGLNIEYGFNGGESNLEEGIIVDFADDQKAYSVICPYLQLEIFVPQPVVSVP